MNMYVMYKNEEYIMCMWAQQKVNPNTHSRGQIFTQYFQKPICQKGLKWKNEIKLAIPWKMSADQCLGYVPLPKMMCGGGGQVRGALTLELSQPDLILPTPLSVWPLSLTALGRSTLQPTGCVIRDFKKAMSVRVNKRRPYNGGNIRPHKQI
jgi:hypothetical protein